MNSFKNNKAGVLLIIFSFILIFGCNIPNTTNLNNIKAVNEGLYAIPLPSKEFTDLDRFISSEQSFSRPLDPIYIPIDEEITNAINNNSSVDIINLALAESVKEIQPFTSEVSVLEGFFSNGSSADEIEIISAKIKSGQLIFDFSSYQGPFNIIFETYIPQFKNNILEPFKEDIGLNTNNNLNLVGLLSPNEEGKIVINLKVKEITYIQDSNGDAVSDINITPTFKMEAFLFDNIKGYFGTFNLNNIISIDSSFDAFIGEGAPFKFHETGFIISLSVDNPIGIPFQFDLSDFVFIDASGRKYNITDKDGKGLTHDIKSAEVNDQDEVKSIVTDIIIGSENTNIDEILAKDPIEMELNVSLNINPEGRPANLDTQFNFLQTGVVLKLGGKAQLPLVIEL